MRTINEQILDNLLRHQIYLLRHASSLTKDVSKLIADTEKDIEAELSKFLRDGVSLASQKDYARLNGLLQQISAIRGEGWINLESALTDSLAILSTDEAEFMRTAIETPLPVVITTAMPAASLLKTIATDRPFAGRLLKEWADKLEADDLARLSNAIKVGMVQGEGMGAIVSRVFGTGAMKYTDGAANLTYNDIEALVRTAVMHVSNDSHAEFIAKNTDIIQQEQILATLDSRTSPLCRALDHSVYKVGEGPRPPLHIRCRSLRIPVIDGYQLGDRPMRPTTEKQMIRDFIKENPSLKGATSLSDFSSAQLKQYDKFRKNTLRETFGRVAATTSYQDWLTKQPNWFQEDVLGIQKAKLFREGGLTLDKFVDLKTGHEFTIDQLREKHPTIVDRVLK